MAGQRRQLPGIPSHTLSLLQCFSPPVLGKCRRLRCAELAWEKSSPQSQNFSKLGPRLLHGPRSCWQGATGRIPQHTAWCQRGHPVSPPPQFGTAPKGHLNPPHTWHGAEGHLSPCAHGTVPGGSERGTLSLCVAPRQV